MLDLLLDRAASLFSCLRWLDVLAPTSAVLHQHLQKLDELVQLDELEKQWTELHALEFSPDELQVLENLESLLKRIRESEEAFETNMNHEKQLLSKEMNQLRQQVNYSTGMKTTAPGRTKKVF